MTIHSQSHRMNPHKDESQRQEVEKIIEFFIYILIVEL